MKGVQSMNMESSKNTLVSSFKANKKIRIKTGYHVESVWETVLYDGSSLLLNSMKHAFLLCGVG